MNIIGTTLHGNDKHINFTESSSGVYTGNGAVNRAINHGMSVKPRYVRITTNTGTIRQFEVLGEAWIIYGGSVKYVVTIPDTTNFYVGQSGALSGSGNGSGESYSWVAFG